MKFVIFTNHGIWCKNTVQTYDQFCDKIARMEQVTGDTRKNFWYVIGDDVVTWETISAMSDSLPMEKDLI